MAARGKFEFARLPPSVKHHILAGVLPDGHVAVGRLRHLEHQPAQAPLPPSGERSSASFTLAFQLRKTRDGRLLLRCVLDLGDLLSRFVLLGAKFLKLPLCSGPLLVEAQNLIDIDCDAFQLRPSAVFLGVSLAGLSDPPWKHVLFRRTALITS